MQLEASTIWWLAFGLLVLAELFSGSFYLLMLALGAAAAASGAHLGLGTTAQLLLAAVLGCAALFFCYRVRRRLRHSRAAKVAASGHVGLDNGSLVMVERWEPDGTARVQYRGAQWTVRCQKTEKADGTQASGMHRVVEFCGNDLLVEKVQE